MTNVPAQPEPVAMQAQEPGCDKEILDEPMDADKEIAEDSQEPNNVDQPMEPEEDASAAQPSLLMQSTLSISPATSPKQLYMD